MTNCHRVLGALAVVGVSVALGGCAGSADVAETNFSVTSTASECAVSDSTASSGKITFDVKNDGDQSSDFYLLADDGRRVVAEVANVAPSSSRELTLVVQPGKYFTLCKPGTAGEGVGRSPFTVTGEPVEDAGDAAEQKREAVQLYAAFVKEQVGRLKTKVDEFVSAYEQSNDENARTLYPQARVFYERIEPVAEALGTLDPRIDYREVDARAEGLQWTGFHRMEKDLWVPSRDALNADGSTPAWQDWAPSTASERSKYARLLRADIQELYDYVHSDDFVTALEEQGIGGISNGAIALLDEVATGKITGEEDWWSSTDLYDFAANVEGSKIAFSLVKDIASGRGAAGEELVIQIEEDFAELEEALAKHGSIESGFVDYSALSDDDKRELADLLNAVAEPLSQLTATLLG